MRYTAGHRVVMVSPHDNVASDATSQTGEALRAVSIEQCRIIAEFLALDGAARRRSLREYEYLKAARVRRRGLAASHHCTL
jgi:hypothetical protein